MTLFDLDGQSPEINPEAWIAPTATLIGKIRVKRKGAVWFGAVMRGDNEWITVGEGSNIQDLVLCHTDMGYPLDVGENCTIGHSAILHGCQIGTGSLIGMGATIMNGANIGRECLIGAGSLISEGKQIPDGMLVLGRPGKIIRPLTPEERANLYKSAENYQANVHRFQAGLTETCHKRATQ